MSMIPLAVTLCLGALQDVPTPPPPQLPDKYQSKHYDLRTNCTKLQAQELLDFMELVYGTYLSLLRPTDVRELEARRSTLVLYRTEEGYRASKPPANSGAYYNRDTRELVGWYHQVLMPGYFAHEGMHQFTHLTSEDYDAFPQWFSEGIADCFGNNEVRDNKLYMCVRNGALARLRLEVIQPAVRENRHFPLEKLLTLSAEEFGRHFELAYAQSWSLCHFFIAYPLHDDRSRQVPDGKYRRHLGLYYELLRAGKHNHERAWAQAFAGVDLKELEETWKQYVLTMDGGRRFGWNGHEIPAADADKLKLHSGQGGIVMEDITPGGVAEKAGLRVGDIIIAFDGRPLPRGEALRRVRTSLPDIPYDKPIPVTIMRAGKRIELKAIWPSPGK